eukprot:7160359-Pyramimonas_sp.AAC.1
MVPGVAFEWDCAVTGVVDSERQAVPRAELVAIVECARYVDCAQDLHVASDHANIVTAFAGGRAHTAKLANSDLWWELWEILDSRPASSRLSHIPSHLLEDEKKRERFQDIVDWGHVARNSLADRLADDRASE